MHRTGDAILLDAEAGVLQAQVDAAEWAARTQPSADLSVRAAGFGRELFAHARSQVGSAERGASVFWPEGS